MKAIQIFKYNKHNLRTETVELAKPSIQPNEVLVCVKSFGQFDHPRGSENGDSLPFSSNHGK